jgi:NADPH:quinone reductase-like Zn-dependent oxidoreductase
VCSTTRIELVRSVGADHIIDYTQHDFADGQERYDLILDIGGNSPLSRLRRALRSRECDPGSTSGERWIVEIVAVEGLVRPVGWRKLQRTAGRIRASSVASGGGTPVAMRASKPASRRGVFAG